MFEAVGHPVLKLKRVRLGIVTLDGMRKGDIRLLKPYENDSVEVVGGMFLIRQVVGIGDLPRSQDEVSVHYVTYNANEEVLDSTYERDQPFTYIIGQQGQVLKGFD